MRAGIGRHEGDGPDGYVGLKELLGTDYGSDGVSVEMESKLIERTASCQVLMPKRSCSDIMHNNRQSSL